MALCIWLVLLGETLSLGKQHPWGNIIPGDRYPSSLGEKDSLPNGTMAMVKCHPYGKKLLAQGLKYVHPKGEITYSRRGPL
jgi:hypothetical protein